MILIDDADSRFLSKETDHPLPDVFIGINRELYALKNIESQVFCYLEDGNLNSTMTQVSIAIMAREFAQAMGETAIKEVKDTYAGEEVDLPLEVDEQTNQQLLGYHIEH